MNSLTPFWTVSLFWTAAAICVAMALAFVLPPLLRKRSAVEKARVETSTLLFIAIR
jgi:cytochrome c-type biogenesis protein CcmH